MDPSVAHYTDTPLARRGRILLAVPESDCHVVGNKLLEFFLIQNGYEVHNLGACTPAQEIAAAARELQPDAIVISSHNGHAFEDLMPLSEAMHAMGVPGVPVYLGGKLLVGADKRFDGLPRQFSAIGVQVVASIEELEQRLSLP